jgi:hypothetical protein
MPTPDLPLDLPHLLALAAALGWASGLRLYAVVFATGLAGFLGWLPLPDKLQLLEHPVVLWGSGVMLVVEFLADKVPWLDSAWDAVHTFLRIPAGAALAAGVFGDQQPQWALLAALAGGTLAATAHAAKATTRAALNTSPEPFTNWSVSLFEDGLVATALWLAWAHPAAFFVLLAVALAAMVALTALLFRYVRRLLRRWRGREVPT